MKKPPKVRAIYLNPRVDGGKVGLDDFLAAGHTVAELLDKATETLRSASNSEYEFPYKETTYGLVYLKPTRDGTIEIPLCNFTARITADLCEDDGAGVRRVLEIEAQQRARKVIVRVPGDRFTAMHWPTEALGARAILAPGFAVKDHVRAAIQLFSQESVVERQVYTHTGWRKVNGSWVYLHAGGAISLHGVEPDIEVVLPAGLEGYRISIPLQAQECIHAARASLRVLKVMPPRIAYPSYAAVWRAVLGNVDYAGFLYGKTGKGKSEWAALQQQHYGAEMDRLHLPGNFSSTGNNLEALAFLVKDALYVIDDFCPTGSSADGQRYHKEADRIIRAQGNRSGRGRSRSDGTPRPAKPPRGLVLGTGEEVPKGQSLRSRMWTLEILEGNMNWSLLTECQRDAAAGQYAQAMAAYVHWLAPRYEGIRAGLKEEMQILRTQALQGAHRRTPEIVAHLAVGFRYFLQFALDVGAISQTEKDELWQAAWSALGEAAQAQARFLGESDPTGRFIELLVSAVSSGDAHIAGIDGDTPPHPSTWGWREATVGTGDHERREWRPQGKRIGWVDKDALYLDPEASFAAAQALANRQGDALPVSPQTLRARLKEDGHLASWDIKRQRNTVRRVVEGREMAVLHLTAKTFTQTGCPPSPKPGANALTCKTRVRSTTC